MSLPGNCGDDSRIGGETAGGKGQVGPHRSCQVGVRSQPVEPAGVDVLQLRLQVRLVGGESGRAMAAAQGQALRALLASVGKTEVRPGQELSP
jgi:hypothetical protein